MSGAAALDRLEDLGSRPADDLSPEQEGELVELRRAAFDELARGAGPADWPPPHPDPAPDVPGLLAIDASDLDAATIGGALQHRGCLKVDALLDADQIATIRRDLRESFGARPDWGRPDAPESAARYYRRFEADRGKIDNFGKRNHVRLADCPRGLSDVLRIYTEVGLLGAIREYLGERPALSVNKSSMRRVKPNFSLDYHQDGAFLGEEIRTVNVWLALTDCGVDAPGLDLVPARMDRILPTGENGAAFDWTVSAATVADLEEGEVVRPEFHAGDVLLFDQMLVHRTGNAGDMPNDREAVESWFFAPSGYPDGHCPLLV